jgi:small-conductance mechanosensitive channel
MVTNKLTQEVEVESVEVIFNGQKLFDVRGVSSVPADKRAERLVARLKRMARSPLVDTAAIEVHHDDELKASIIMVGDEYITVVWDSDAAAAGDLAREKLAEQYADKLKNIIDQYRKDHTTESYIKGAVFAALATAVFLAIWFAVSRLKRRELRYVENRFAGQKMLKFIDGDTVVSVNGGIIKLITTVVMLLVFISYLNIVLSFFPWTFNLSAKLFSMISTPFVRFSRAFVENIPNLFALLVIWLLTHYVLRSLKHVFSQIREGKVRIRGFYQDWADTTYTLVKMVIIVFAVVVAVPFIPGAGSPAFKGISIFMGVLVSLGSSSAVGNIFGGLMLTYMRSFMPGDFVEINGMQGTVMSRRTFSTRLKTITNEIISIPNSAVSSNHIINYSKMTKSGGVNVGTVVTIGYDVAHDTVKSLLLKSAEGVENVLENPAPKVLILGLEDFYVRYKLIVSTKNPAGKFGTLSHLHDNILANFAKAGVEIMSPHYRANRAGDDLTIPEQGPHQES